MAQTHTIPALKGSSLTTQEKDHTHICWYPQSSTAARANKAKAMHGQKYTKTKLKCHFVIKNPDDKY